MSPNSTAQELAQRLIQRQRAAHGGDATRAPAAALAVEELYVSLSRWIGGDGCHALFSRARAQAIGDHPSLEALQLRAREPQYVAGVADGVEEYGDKPIADAIESMLAGMIELLGRLIGVDMAINLIERSLPVSARSDAEREKRRAMV